MSEFGYERRERRCTEIARKTPGETLFTEKNVAKIAEILGGCVGIKSPGLHTIDSIKNIEHMVLWYTPNDARVEIERNDGMSSMDGISRITSLDMEVDPTVDFISEGPSHLQVLSLSRGGFLNFNTHIKTPNSPK